MYQNPYMNPYIQTIQNPYQNIQPIQNFQTGNFQQPQMPQQITPPPLTGRFVSDFSNITANDVPMDGNVAWFPKNDLSEIQARSWKSDGTIETVLYKRVENVPAVEENTENNALNAIDERLKRIEDLLSKPKQAKRKEVSDYD